MSFNLQQKSLISAHAIGDGATCTNVGNVILPNFIDNGPTIRPAIFISFLAVCNEVDFKHGEVASFLLIFRRN